ncbi:MAG: hypothetical protein Q9187_006412, partial [Circinaria calcarea]
LKELCLGWANYNPELNSLNIVHTRNYDLPADVFGPGEVKPVKPKKKTTKKIEPVSKKRSFEASGLEDPPILQNGIKRRQSENGTQSIKSN